MPTGYEVPSGGITTIADLDRTPARLPLAGMIATEGTTIVYGRGGTGKGVTAAYLMSSLVREDKRVVAVDFEGHPEEWAERLDALGLTEDEQRMVIYLTPFGDH